MSIEEAAEFLRSLGRGRILNQSAGNMLVDLQPSDLPVLRQRLAGWIIAPQGAKTQVPNTRLKLGSR